MDMANGTDTPNETTKRGPGRPTAEVDARIVEEAAGLGCTLDEIAVLARCSVSTLLRHFDETIKKGREDFKMSLRRLQFKSAKDGSVPMQIWLGKQYLNQKDRIVEERVVLDDYSENEIREALGVVAEDDTAGA